MEDIKIRSLRDRQKEKLDRLDTPEKAPDDKSPEEKPIQLKKKRHLIKKLAKLIGFTIFVFFFGGLGGIWLDRIILPTLLAEYPALNQYESLKRINERTTIIHETEEIKISQEEGAAEAIGRVRPSITEILAKDANGQFAKIGTGIILTSDGYLITPLKNIFINQAINTEIQVKLRSGETYSAGIAAQNPDYSLAILKIEKNDLPVIPYADSDSLRLGDRLILIDDMIATDIISKLIDQYIMPGSTDSSFQKRIQIARDLGASSTGAAVINLEGNLVGVGQEADIIIPLNEIKDFISQSTTKK